MPTCFAETLLHLAVKAKHSEIVELLTARGVTQLVLNAKDSNGNTILHLAFAGRQQNVIKHLLSQADIDVNPVNSAGLTPLDVLLVTNHEMGDLYLGEMIRAAGGKTAKELRASETNIVECSSPIDNRKTSLHSTPNNQMTRTTSRTEESYNKNEKSYIVVATLVATLTFAAALNPPGGSIQMSFEDSDRENPNWFRKWKHLDTVYPAGSPVYLWRLKNFFIYDYLALFASIFVILLCLPGVFPRSNTTGKLLPLVLWSSMFFMVLAFNSALSILLYTKKNSALRQPFLGLFEIFIYFFAIVGLILSYKFYVSIIEDVVHKANKQIPSWMSNIFPPKVI